MANDGEQVGDFRAVVVLRAGAVRGLIVGNANNRVVAVHVIGLRQGLKTQFVAGEGMQAVLRPGDELDPRLGLPQKNSRIALVGEPHEEEIQVASVLDIHAAGIFDLEGIPEGLAVVLVLDHAETDQSHETDQLERRGNI